MRKASIKYDETRRRHASPSRRNGLGSAMIASVGDRSCLGCVRAGALVGWL
jgi:hypothetical protein